MGLTVSVVAWGRWQQIDSVRKMRQLVRIVLCSTLKDLLSEASRVLMAGMKVPSLQGRSCGFVTPIC